MTEPGRLRPLIAALASGSRLLRRVAAPAATDGAAALTAPAGAGGLLAAVRFGQSSRRLLHRYADPSARGLSPRDLATRPKRQRRGCSRRRKEARGGCARDCGLFSRRPRPVDPASSHSADATHRGSALGCGSDVGELVHPRAKLTVALLESVISFSRPRVSSRRARRRRCGCWTRSRVRRPGAIARPLCVSARRAIDASVRATHRAFAGRAARRRAKRERTDSAGARSALG